MLNSPLQVRSCSLGSRGQTRGWCGLRAAETQPHSLQFPSLSPLLVCGILGAEQDLSPHVGVQSCGSSGTMDRCVGLSM